MIIEFGIERAGRRLEAARLLLFISRALLVNRHVSSKVVILRQTTLGPLNGPLSIRLYLAIEVGVERPHIKILAWRPLLQIMIQRFAWDIRLFLVALLCHVDALSELVMKFGRILYMRARYFGSGFEVRRELRVLNEVLALCIDFLKSLSVGDRARRVVHTRLILYVRVLDGLGTAIQDDLISNILYLWPRVEPDSWSGFHIWILIPLLWKYYARLALS